MQTNDAIADVLEDIALLMELKGENAFKTRAYRSGAETIRGSDKDITQVAKAGDLEKINGIGKALNEKITELVTTGKMEFYDKLKGHFPASLFELFDISGLGPKKIKAVYDKLGVDSIDTLQSACESGKLSELSGFGAKTVTKLLEAIEFKKKHASLFLLGKIAPIALQIREHLASHPKVNQCEISGSFRRGKETLHDIDFLVSSTDNKEVIDFFTQLPEAEKIISKGETKAQIYLADGLQCDLRAVTNDQFPFALQYFTGSKEHNVAIRSRAKKHGLSLNEYGFTSLNGDDTETLPTVTTEADIYRVLELDYIPPALRENRGEILAAEDGTLPNLVKLENLKGCFHNHTTASDGKNSLEEMANAAMDLGLEYLGIADHSKSSFQANGLYTDRLLKQVAEIRKLNKQWDGFQILAGSEVDILKDGSLDFDDSILSQLDYVVASVHNAFTLDEASMTKRIISAMENPHVTMIGHLTGRILLRRQSYAVNIEKIIDCAVETGTIIELNANYYRLDMDWRWWKHARDKGVKCAINPDAHHVDHLQFLHYGILQARKGWLRKSDVINTLSLAEIQDWLKLH